MQPIRQFLALAIWRSLIKRELKHLAVLACDNCVTHKHPTVKVWLEKHPHFYVHFTPTSASWLNMVERFLRSISTDRLERAVFRSVPELTTAIEGYIAVHNQTPKPFVWAAKANDILQKVIRANRRLGSKKNEALDWNRGQGQPIIPQDAARKAAQRS